MRDNATDEPNADQVRRECSRLGLEIDAGQATRLALYLGALLRWNRKVNLVGARTWSDALALAADSWPLADYLDTLGLPTAPLVYDLGAGAGLPGIPLRVLWSRGEYVMVDSRSKRSAFLHYVIGLLGLERTRAVAGRAETLLGEGEQPDAVLSRAFMPWPEFLAFVRDASPGVAVVMSNDPPPAPEDVSARAPGWVAGKSMEYAAGNKTRYFWSFSPSATSM